MSFPQSFLDQVKGSFRLSDYIGRSLQLKRAGREFVALSPFVKEKTPSFCVNDEKAFFHDFASGKHGDIIDWLVEHEGLTFVDAVKRLAHEAGLEVPERDARARQADDRRQYLERILGEAQNYFQGEIRAERGRTAREYLYGRGLTDRDIERFGIGYAPDSKTGLRDLLLARGYSYDDSLAAGVLALPEGGHHMDRYRHRITFPISDVAGRPISFGARALDPTARAKYLNGPDTELFDKGRNLYGLDISRRILAAGVGPLLVAEGYLDVIACLRAGIAACAPMGTSLTEAQLELMWRYHREPTLCFDGDSAGRRAAARAIDLAVPKIGATRSLRFVTILNAKDPDELLRTRGADALRSQLMRAAPLVDSIFARERGATPLDTPEQRADLRERLRAIVRKIGDRDVSKEYAEAFKVRLDAMRKRPPNEAPAAPEAVESARALRSALPPTLRALAYWLVKDPERALDEIESLDRGFGHEALDHLAREVVSWMMSGSVDGERLTQHLVALGLGEVVANLGDPEGRLADAEVWQRAWRARAEYLRLEAEIRRVKATINGPQALQEFMALKAQRDRAKAAL